MRWADSAHAPSRRPPWSRPSDAAEPWRRWRYAPRPPAPARAAAPDAAVRRSRRRTGRCRRDPGSQTPGSPPTGARRSPRPRCATARVVRSRRGTRPRCRAPKGRGRGARWPGPPRLAFAPSGVRGSPSGTAPACRRPRVWAGREFLSRYLAVKNLILNASSVIWRRDVLLDAFAGVGADLFDYRVAGDWRLYVEAANSPGSVAFCATPLNVHRRHTRSVTHSLDERRHYEEICRVQNAAARYLGTDAELAAKIDAYRKEIREYFRIDEDAGWQVIKNAAI